MKILKPKFWQSNKISFFAIILFPFTFLFSFALLIKRKLSISNKFKIPIICVGNIFVGGTGKTPLSIEIAKSMRGKKKSVIIKKFYKNHIDEHNLIKHHSNLILGVNRKRAVEQAEELNYDLAILDDGFQDYSLKKDLNILCFNSNQLIGNGFTLPSGPLRENLNSVKRAEIIIINGDKNEKFERKLLKVSKNIKIFYTKYIPVDLDKLENKKILAFAGIGNPENFFDLLAKNGIEVEKNLTFPDHYNYQKSEIQKIIDYAKDKDLKALTTEKDYYRLKELGFSNVEYLKVKLKIEKEDEFFNEIFKYV